MPLRENEQDALADKVEHLRVYEDESERPYAIARINAKVPYLHKKIQYAEEQKHCHQGFALTLNCAQQLGFIPEYQCYANKSNREFDTGKHIDSNGRGGSTNAREKVRE